MAIKMSVFASPLQKTAPSEARGAVNEGGKNEGLPVAPFIILGDTDAHGTTLSASFLRALLDSGVPSESIAVHSHFDTRGISTSARGDLIGYVKKLVDSIVNAGIRPTIFINDIPAPVNALNEYVEALAQLASVSERIIYTDTAGHGYNAQLPVMLAKKGVSNIQFRLALSVPQTYLPAALMAPSVQVYDLSVLGTVLDMDIQAIPELNWIRELAEQAEETSLPPVTIDTVRAKMHEFVAFDNYLKFGRDWPQPTERVKLWGNMAQKVAVMATTPIAELFSKAVSFANIPSIDQVRSNMKITGFVAVVDMLAPKGHMFNYAKLGQAAADIPIVIAYSEGFKPGKKVIAVTPNAFMKEEEPVAIKVIETTVKEVFDDFVNKGWSNPKDDFPRGHGAMSVGVSEQYLRDALSVLVEKLNAHYIETDRAKYVSQITRAEMLALVADEKLASTVASIVEKAVRAVADACNK